MGTGTTSTTVVMYEPLTNHNNDGINVLFADIHIEFVRMDEAMEKIEALQAKQRAWPSSRRTEL